MAFHIIIFIYKEGKNNREDSHVNDIRHSLIFRNDTVAYLAFYPFFSLVLFIKFSNYRANK